MRYILLGCALVLFSVSCSDALTVESEQVNAAGNLTFVNAAARPFAVVVFNAEDMPLIDPIPAFSVEQFEERKIEVGAAAAIDTEYDRGEDAYVLIYAQCDCELGEWVENFAGPNAAPLIQSFAISSDVLKALGYRVVVEDL